MKEICSTYVGVSCVDGTCPIANRDEYIEYGIPVVWDCAHCHYYEGCEDCALSGTKYCEMQVEIMKLIEKYAKKHELAKECGAEYIFQSDRAQEDALELVGNIFDLYVRG